MHYPKQVLFLCVWLQILVLLLLLLDTQNLRAVSFRYNARSGSKHRHGFAGRFKCLPKSKASSILRNRQYFFVVNSLANVILAVSQQQSHHRLFSLRILTGTATQEMTLLAPEVAILVAGMVGGSLCPDTALLSWSWFFSQGILRMLETGSFAGYWAHSSFNLFGLSLISHLSAISHLPPDDLFLKVTVPFLTSFPLWTQVPLSSLIGTSRLVAATLPYKKKRNFSSTISNYWRQAVKAWKIFGSKKHQSNLIRVQTKGSF